MLSNKKRLISKEYLIKCIISSLDLQKSVCKVNNQHWVMILGISHALKTGMILSLKSQKSLSVDTVHHAIHKYGINSAEMLSRHISPMLTKALTDNIKTEKRQVSRDPPVCPLTTKDGAQTALMKPVLYCGCAAYMPASPSKPDS